MKSTQLRNHTDAQILTVFFHGGCSDGIAGAWALYEALPEKIRVQLTALGGLFTDGCSATDSHEQFVRVGAVFHGLSHSDGVPAPELVVGRHVVYVDITPPMTVAVAVADAARTLTILDHHRSGKVVAEDLAVHASDRGLPYTSIYTESLSGAQIAWDWAHEGTPRPEVIDYVGDRDLWAFLLPDSRAVNKALYIEGHTRGFGPLTALRWSKGGGVDALVALRGGAYLRYEEQVVARLASNARLATIAALPPGETAPREYCVKVVNTSILLSEVGEAVMEKAGPEVHFVILWAYSHDRDEIWVSARTNRPDVDLSAITPYIVGGKVVDGRTGGGHPRAAGFTIAGDSIGAVVRPIAQAI
jgi:hypothetical protein